MKTLKSRFTSLSLCLACQHRISCCLMKYCTIPLSFRRCDWLFPPSAREVSYGNRPDYKPTRERVVFKGLYGRWRLHLMGSCPYPPPPPSPTQTSNGRNGRGAFIMWWFSRLNFYISRLKIRQ